MYILCDFNLFDLQQSIKLVAPDGGITEVGVSNLEDLGSNIAYLCNEYGVSEVKLFGGKLYGDQIVEQIFEAGKNKYGYFDINVEVM